MFFWIFVVLAILWYLVSSKLAFYSILGKKAHFEHTGHHEMAKKPNIQQKSTNFCSKYKVHLYQQLSKLDISVGPEMFC